MKMAQILLLFDCDFSRKDKDEVNKDYGYSLQKRQIMKQKNHNLSFMSLMRLARQRLLESLARPAKVPCT